ncbi:MAG TPA: alpha/beta hydrolase family protein [Fulvivirga sp.]|nr:alpha/beta hydrolase family protein [Fulvivirga sp.]
MVGAERYSKLLTVLLLVVMLPLCLGGCKEESVPLDPVPFERLLENQKLHSEIFKVDINYAVLLPADYAESTDEYPVVYLLHGYGDNERAWYTSGGIPYYSDLYKDEITPMIYVMPAGYTSYYVNKYTGNYPFMDMITTELVPTIDELFRTKKDKNARAVMGYSMGGYGALILPVLNPDIFTVGVPLSMSFRTDEQYMAEPQRVFDAQWGTIFGGNGAVGEARLTDYFKQHSPFYLFNTSNTSQSAGLKLLIDCGDDEESLTITNDAMHAVMRDHDIPHEYRVRSGGHSFDYWKKSYPEALKFISNAFQGIEHPSEPEAVSLGTLISASDYETLELSGESVHILKPTDYATSNADYPVLYFIHDFDGTQHDEKLLKSFSLLRNNMASGKIPQSIIVEIAAGENINAAMMNQIVAQVDLDYRTKQNATNRMLLGNANGGLIAAKLVSETSDVFNACFLFDANLSDEEVVPQEGIFYYLDITDEGQNYNGYHAFYKAIREQEIGYEYRVRQGSASYQGFLNGLSNSFTYMKSSLNN